MRFRVISNIILLAISLAFSYEVEWEHSIGYLGNIPGAFIGLNITGYRIKSVGYHLAFKTNMGGRSGRDNYYDNIYPGKFDDPLRAESNSYMIIDAGITRKLFGRLYAIGGFGVTFFDKYLEYRDPSGILGDSSNEYWISDDDESYITPNVTGALTYLFKTKSNYGISLTLGGDLEPPGVIAGIGVTF